MEPFDSNELKSAIRMPGINWNIAFFGGHFQITNEYWHMPPERHSAFEVIQIISGSEQIKIQDEVLTLESNDILLIKPNTLHEIWTGEQTSYFNFHFNVSDARFVNNLVMHKNLIFNSSKDTELTESLGAMRALLNQKMIYDFKTEFQILIYLSDFLLALMESVPGGAGKRTNSVILAEKLRELIQSNLATRIQSVLTNNVYSEKLPELNLAQMAQKLQISPSYAFEVFKKTYKQSPRQYLTKLIMQEAQNWLLIPEIRIQDISYALGYSDPAHFTRQFKKWTGETPRQFQKQVSPTG